MSALRLTKRLKFLEKGVLQLSGDWLNDEQVHTLTKHMKRAVMKTSLEFMKVKKIIFGGRKGRVEFDFEAEKSELLVLKIELR